MRILVGRSTTCFVMVCALLSGLSACEKPQDLTDSKPEASTQSEEALKEVEAKKPVEPKSGLPEIAPAKRGDRKQASQFNKKGLAAHKAKNYNAAAALFTQAVKADPSHHLARYNLACASQLSGDSDKAIAILREFKEEACPLCIKQLLFAPKDKDFKGLWTDEAFVDVTTLDLAKLREGGAPAAAKVLEEAYRKGDPSLLSAWWPASGEVRYRYYGTVAVDEVPKPKLTSVKTIEKEIKSFGEMMRNKDELPMTFYGFGKITCKDNCCLGLHRGETHHGAERLQKVCVDKEGAISHLFAYGD